MHNAHYGLGNAPIIVDDVPERMHGRFAVTDNVCGFSFAQVDAAGADRAVAATTKAQSFAGGNGTPTARRRPWSTTTRSAARALAAFAISPTSGRPTSRSTRAVPACAGHRWIDGHRRRTAATATSTRPTAAQSAAVRAGIAEVLLNGNLRGKPTLIVAGRSDALVPVNHNARAYVAYNQVEGAASKVALHRGRKRAALRHLPALLGFDTRFVPLHVYYTAPWT